jgi:hypothetical protein
MVAVLLVFVPSLALAGPKLLPGSEHEPPLVLDETSVTVRVHASGDDKKGYAFQAHVAMGGFASATDRARIELKKDGKLFATVKCDLRIEINNSYAVGDCEYQDKPLTPVGQIVGELIYTDDQTEKDYLVRTFSLPIVHLVGHYDTWSNVPDDTLGAAWIILGHDEDKDDNYRRPELLFWVATGDGLASPTLRCTVNGSKKIADIELGDHGSSDQQITIDTAKTTITWRRISLVPHILWGKRETLRYKPSEPDAVLSDNPGKWECALRSAGKTLRILNFGVDADGMVKPDEMQSGKGAIPVFNDRMILIDFRLGKDAATFDKRINPDAMRKSMGFGLPWPDHAHVKAIHASYPQKSGPELR